MTIDGVGHPAQWGTGTWAVADDGSTRIGVSCFNRLWHFGTASGTVGDADGFAYRSGALPLGRGRLTARRHRGLSPEARCRWAVPLTAPRLTVSRRSRSSRRSRAPRRPPARAHRCRSRPAA